ncbi:MAG: hydroxyacid dehydrogenase [bacterium]|nr:hydroxyacid dehydrogenase [bacterium]MDE0287214.1 hydroxyacid dehydrogenase [bacterium]MDE0438274.1 hydroxyacid dehydrogenase [bacterium]
MSYDIVFLDRVELTPVSRQALDEVGTVRTVPVTAQEDLLPAVRDADAVVYHLFPNQLTRDVLERCRRLKAIGRIGIGMDQVDVQAAADCGMTVVNAAGAQAAAVADHAMALMLSLARKVVVSHTALLAGDRSPPWQFMGFEMEGRSLGIVGFGAIGRRLAQRAFGFGMVAQAYDPYVPADAIEQAGATPCELDEVLAGSDFISIHVPLTDETWHLIGERELAMMRPTAYLINTARGPIVDETALVAALHDGVIAGAGLDVFEEEPLPAGSPLLALDRVVLTPHIAGWAIEAQTRTQESVIKDVARVLRGEPPISPVRASEGPASPRPSTATGSGHRLGGPGRGPELLPYTEWEESGLPHPSSTHAFGAVPGLRKIIETEGPVTTDRAYKVYVRGSGSTRVTKLVRTKLDQAVARLLDQKQVQVDELGVAGSREAQRVLRVPGGVPVVVREIGSRDLYEIPLNEVVALMERRLDKHPGASHEELMRHVLNSYGWRRLTDKARTYLTAAIHLMYEE